MYTQLTQYYLKQLGIRPWVAQASTEPTSRAQLVVLLQQSSNKVQAFVHRVLSFLQVGKADAQILLWDEYTEGRLNHLNPKAVLALGVDGNQIKEFQGTVLSSFSPEELFSNPQQKKILFHALHELNEQTLKKAG